LLIAAMGCVGCASAPPRDYYYSTHGDDSSGDGSLLRPLRSMAKAGALSLNPGDRMLFEGGAVFDGNLVLNQHGAGRPEQPVYIGSFGNGRATIRAGEGTGVQVRNAGGVIIENLVIEGAGSTRNLGSGVQFVNERSGRDRRLKFVRVKNVEAHGFGLEGIHLDALGESGFEDVRIENCLAYDNARCGIYVAGPRERWDVYPHANVYVGNCVARDNPGDPDAPEQNRSGSGIFLTGVDGGVIENCAASGNGRRCRADRGGPMGIWASESNRIIIQSCRSTGNRTGGAHDGGGFGFDGGMTYSILQYNYSSDNDGSGFGLFEYPGAKPWHDNTVRYNVSVDDGRRNGYAGLHVWNGDGVFRDAWIYHNTVVVSPAKGAKVPCALWIQSETTGLRIMNNIFCTAPGMSIMDIAPGQRSILLAGNCCWSGGGDGAVGGFAQSPRFVGQGERANRFRLAAGSPLIDAAASIPVHTGGRDFGGTPLPQGKNTDVGAWESPAR
jgi:hypothetical protein